MIFGEQMQGVKLLGAKDENSRGCGVHAVFARC